VVAFRRGQKVRLYAPTARRAHVCTLTNRRMCKSDSVCSLSCRPPPPVPTAHTLHIDKRYTTFFSLIHRSHSISFTLMCSALWSVHCTRPLMSLYFFPLFVHPASPGTPVRSPISVVTAGLAPTLPQLPTSSPPTPSAQAWASPVGTVAATLSQSRSTGHRADSASSGDEGGGGGAGSSGAGPRRPPGVGTVAAGQGQGSAPRPSPPSAQNVPRPARPSPVKRAVQPGAAGT
jgi:hypothetical protein